VSGPPPELWGRNSVRFSQCSLPVMQNSTKVQLAIS
jgi:hypothetical protein